MSPDDCIVALDRALRTLFAPATAARAHPGTEQAEAKLSEEERAHAAALMRVNHTGEICAQALYQGQALASRNVALVRTLDEASREENDHLAWTERRLDELGGHKSLFNPVWYAGSFLLGAVAGKLGDDWNLGFLAETERQVESHLDEHKARLPKSDRRSWLLLEQMRQDEAKHAATARRLGAREMPELIKKAMWLAAKTMKATAYRI